MIGVGIIASRNGWKDLYGSVWPGWYDYGWAGFAFVKTTTAIVKATVQHRTFLRRKIQIESARMKAQVPRDTARAMSGENVERFREAVEAINAGDLETALDAVHPEVEWRTLDIFPDAGTYHGREGVLAFFQMWLGTFRGFQLHLENCAAVGKQRVLAGFRVSGVGAESGAEVKSPPFFQVVGFRDGLMLRARMFQTESEALEAAGLSE